MKHDVLMVSSIMCGVLPSSWPSFEVERRSWERWAELRVLYVGGGRGKTTVMVCIVELHVLDSSRQRETVTSTVDLWGRR